MSDPTNRIPIAMMMIASMLFIHYSLLLKSFFDLSLIISNMSQNAILLSYFPLFLFLFPPKI